MTSTPRPVKLASKFPLTRLARFLAWAAIPSLEKLTSPFTSMPNDLRCSSFFMSRTRPLAASNALEGTHPRLTQVPPTSSPEKTAVLRFWARLCSAAPCPPTPHPMMATSKSYEPSAIRREVENGAAGVIGRATGWKAWTTATVANKLTSTTFMMSTDQKSLYRRDATEERKIRNEIAAAVREGSQALRSTRRQQRRR
jgi:hypothetical protein